MFLRADKIEIKRNIVEPHLDTYCIDKLKLCTIMSDYTKVNVFNNTSEPVEVFLTFAAQNATNKCCPTPVGLSDFPFLKPVPNQPLRGSFTLGAKEGKMFDSNGQCFSGNFGFYIQPQCPVPGADFNNGKDGTSIAEFTFNPSSACYEAFDISCVNGVNCYLEMSVEAGQGWYYGPDNTPIEKIYNKGLQENAGLPGVYPVNCTDCIQLVGPAPCKTLPIGPAQTERICNIQRPGRGGTVTITLLDEPAG